MDRYKSVQNVFLLNWTLPSASSLRPQAQILLTADHQVSAAGKASHSFNRSYTTTERATSLNQVQQRARLWTCFLVSRSAENKEAELPGRVEPGEWSKPQGVVGRDLGLGRSRSPAGRQIPVNRRLQLTASGSFLIAGKTKIQIWTTGRDALFGGIIPDKQHWRCFHGLIWNGDSVTNESSLWDLLSTGALDF